MLEELCGWAAASREGEDMKETGTRGVNGIGCRTLFATHYHDLLTQQAGTTNTVVGGEGSTIVSQEEQLTSTASNSVGTPFCVTPDRLLPGLQCYTMETVSVGNRSHHDVVHTHRVVPGQASSSYAMHVAHAARLPHKVCERAAQLLRQFEDHDCE